MSGGTPILWRRLDRPGHESARLVEVGELWHLVGSAVFPDEGQACRLDYRVICDRAWRTRSASVSGWRGDQAVEIEIAADPSGRWWLGGRECPAVAGCIDVDLNWSPSTNVLPIRRLGLVVGGEAPVRAAWLRFPSLALEPLEQRYRRLDASTYRYESAGGGFVADLEVNGQGLVVHYPGFARAEAGG